MREPSQHFVAPIFEGDRFHDHPAELRHARREPLGHAPAVQREIGGAGTPRHATLLRSMTAPYSAMLRKAIHDGASAKSWAIVASSLDRCDDPDKLVQLISFAEKYVIAWPEK